MQLLDNIPVWGEPDPESVKQMQEAMKYGAVYGALMADNHLGYSVPVGGVLAYEKQICVNGVGFDIACLDAETEFLSPDGWVRMDKWDQHKVLQYNPITDKANFVLPDRYIKNLGEQEFYHFFHTDALDMMLTANHKVLWWPGYKNRGYKNFKTTLAKDFVLHHNSLKKGIVGAIKTTFDFEGEGLNLSDDILRIIVMVTADGCERKNGCFELHFKKTRKIKRAKHLLETAKIDFKEYLGSDGSVFINFKNKFVFKGLNKFWKANKSQLKILSDEVLFWDGHDGNHQYFSTTNQEEADIVQFANAVSGIRSGIGLVDFPNRKIAYNVYRTKNPFITFTKQKYGSTVLKNGSYCFEVPSGFFVARRNNKIFVTGNCGNKAVRLDADADKVRSDIYRVMNDIEKYISFGVGRKNNERVEHELFDDTVWTDIDILHSLKPKAIEQLGTVGSGNHYVDIFIDDLDRVWVGVHFGSRGLGHSICTHFIKAAGGKDGIHAAPVVLDESSDLGEQYLRCMELAGRYAYAGRDWVCARVAQILKANILEEVHNHHNFAWRENHFGKDLWVVRKGATPNQPGARSFVGGSMGDYSFILEGVDSEESKVSLYSTIHGSGRIMGRSAAKGKYNNKTGECLRVPLINKDDMVAWIKKFDVELRGAGVDEAPMCYKRIESVLFAHRETVKVVQRLKPIGVCMASDKEYDPYKD